MKRGRHVIYCIESRYGKLGRYTNWYRPRLAQVRSILARERKMKNPFLTRYRILKVTTTTIAVK